jgi:citrate synthase
MEHLTAAGAAERLGVKVATIYAYVSRGALASHRAPDGRTSLFRRDDVEALARRGRPRRSTRPPSLDLVIETRLTAIVDHRLLYRGHDATALARSATFEQVAELLWTGAWPVGHPSWTAEPVPGLDGLDVPGLVDRLRAAVVLAGAADPLRGDLRPEACVATARSLLATLVESLPVPGRGRVPRLTLPSGGSPLTATLAGRLWVRLAAGRPPPGMLGVLNAALVLMADHELASSTFAARIAASTRADPYAVVGAGLGPLAGPLHGGAGRTIRRVLEQAAGPTGAGPALAEAMASYGMYPGFGHPLYPDGDPRARVLLDLLRSTAGDTREMRVVDAVLATAESRAPIHHNVDFALAALGFVASLPPAGEEVVVTIARTAGWLAHAIEEYGEAPLRFRPRAVFVP